MIPSFVGSVTLALGCVYASFAMHNIMLKYVLRWPMETFDTTPLGRILNRFAYDVDVIDNILPNLIGSWLTRMFLVI